MKDGNIVKMHSNEQVLDNILATNSTCSKKLPKYDVAKEITRLANKERNNGYKYQSS